MPVMPGTPSASSHGGVEDHLAADRPRRPERTARPVSSSSKSFIAVEVFMRGPLIEPSTALRPPGESSVAQLIFHLLVRQIVERLQNQHPEHQEGIEQLSAGAALLELVRRERHRLDLGAKALPRHEMIDGFERIAPR
jgi:hypothetical protein